MHKLLELFKKQDYHVAYWVMLLAAIPAFLAAFVLSVEKLEVIKNADAVLSCSINAVLNCASVMKTWQASVFGFPNSYLGIMGFAIVIAVAMGGLLGNKHSRAYLVTAQIFYAFGLIFAYWLFFQSVYVIEVLCPWCLVVTAMTTLIFESLLYVNLRKNNFGLSKKGNSSIQKFLDKGFDKLIVASWLVLMVVLVVVKFGDGLFS
ncbi:MAG TPA: vitamin K epoxide reductase family protein [Candidatus Saccharimonadales bacterium]